MPVRIFISTVSDEFRDYRDQLRTDLTRHNTDVKVQEDFQDYGVVTLEKLDIYIRSCDAVVHLVGDMVGSLAKGPSTTFILTTCPDLYDKLPVLAASKSSEISYTQWEAWLAIYHDKLLFIAEPDQTAPRGPKFTPTPESRAAQRTHLDRLRTVERYPGCIFKSPDNLAKHIAYGAILDLLAADMANTRPAALAEPLLDMAATVVVDLMRLVCVAGIDVARAANSARYPAFVNKADLDCDEFIEHISRITDYVGPSVVRRCLAVARHATSVLLSVRSWPKLDCNWGELSSVMAKLTAEVLGLAELLSPERYTKKIEQIVSSVIPALRRVTNVPALQSPDGFFLARMKTQSIILSEMNAEISKLGGPAIRGIGEDIDRRLAIRYFTIDAMLLHATVPASPLRGLARKYGFSQF
jgi:hypothetical protein